MLEEERAYYGENLQEWLTRHANRFVLVKGSNLIGTYDTNEDALREGARLFGREPFLVRRVQESQPTVTIPALALGLLRANPTYPDPTSSTNA